jgi:hypothetical protein
VLVAALQGIPIKHRLPLVLHYMAAVPTELIAEWRRCAPAEVEDLLDDGFDALVALLDWPVEADEYVDGEEYDWTAEALQDSGHRLPQHITTPPPTISFRHATAVKISKRGAPVSAAAACVGLAVALALPGQQPEARPAAFNRTPDVDPFVGPTLAVPPLGPYAVEVPPLGPYAVETTPASATPPSAPPSSPAAERRRPTLAARALPTTPLPVVQVAATPALIVTSTSPTTTVSTPPTTTSPTTTAPTTTAGVAPSTVTVTVTASPTTSPSTTTTTTTTKEEEPAETTTRTRPRRRPPVTTTTTTSEQNTEEPKPTEQETITEELPVTTSAPEDG